MIRTFLLVLALALFPIQAIAQTPTSTPTASPTVSPTASPTPSPTSSPTSHEHYPNVLVDQTCADNYDTPAAATAATKSVRPTAQTSGSSDTFCDHDSRIRTGAITGDTTFGPFSRYHFGNCVYIFADGNTVTGGDTKWRLQIKATQPHNSEAQALDNSASGTGAEDLVVAVGTTTAVDAAYVGDFMALPLPDLWYLLLDLNTATSWTGEISITSCR